MSSHTFLVLLATTMAAGCALPSSAAVRDHPPGPDDRIFVQTLVELREASDRPGLHVDTLSAGWRPDGTSAREPAKRLSELAEEAGIPGTTLEEVAACPYAGAPLLRECGFRDPQVRVVRIGALEVEGDTARVSFSSYGGSERSMYQVLLVAEFERTGSGWRFVRFVTIAMT